MYEQNRAAATLESPQPDTVSFEVMDVTGSFTLQADGVERSMPVRAVAHTLAARLNLPDTPWTLRDDESAALLDDEKPIGEQISQTGSRLTLTPKTHLGAE